MIKTYSYNKDKNTFLSKHFQVGEFRSYNDALAKLTTDTILIDENLVKQLEKIYEALDKEYGLSKIVITSGYRDSDFEEYLSGNRSGYHVKGMASDIMVYLKDNSLLDAKKICLTAEDLGILGIGYGGNYAHIDTRDWKSFFNEVNGEVNIDSWYSYFNISKKTSNKFKIGDTVTINGVYTSSDSDRKLTPSISTGKITKIVANAKNPYLLNNGDIGWINDSVINNNNNTYLSNPNYKGSSIVDALNQIKVDSSFNYRSKIATVNNISNYQGTSSQNLKMLDLLKSGKLIKP